MRIIYLILIGLIFTSTGFSQDKGKLRVTVHNIKSGEGSIHVALFNNEDDFLDNEWTFKSEPVNGSDRLTVEFTDLPEGTYGISVFHDENNNDELDTNFVGIPKEDFGFGNDSMGAFGPPSFKKASVTVGDGVTSTEVKLKSF